jgi:predicted nucleotidyltransferase
MKLDTTSLGNAVRRLREGLARYESEPRNEQLRDGLIQRFEFTYELTHRMLRGYLREAAASPDEIMRMPFADLNVLRAHLPQSSKAWVFGSRATGRARRYSDLDLVIDTGRQLTLDETAQLSEAFSDSDLPYRVDLVDWHNVDDRWRQMILAERVPLTEASPPDAAR